MLSSLWALSGWSRDLCPTLRCCCICGWRCCRGRHTWCSTECHSGKDAWRYAGSQNLIATSPAVRPPARNGIARCCTSDTSAPIHGKREDLEELSRHVHLSQVNVREETGKLPLVSHLRALWNPATEVVRLPSAADRGGPCRAGPNRSLRGWNPGQINHRGARPTRSAAGGSVRLEGPATERTTGDDNRQNNSP